MSRRPIEYDLGLSYQGNLGCLLLNTAASAWLIHDGLAMYRSIRRFLVDESGPTAVEYAVMLALIVAACISSVGILADATGESFDNSAGQLSSVLGS